MAAPILALANAILPGLFRAVDKAIPDKDQAQRLKAELQQQMLDQQGKELEAVSKIIVSEAQSDSWLTRSWRPITMLVFVGVIVGRMFGLTVDVDPAIEAEFFKLVQIGLGGYVVGRTGEGMMKTWAKGREPK